MKKKKSFFFSQQPQDCTPKTLLIESDVTITVFFLHPIPLFVSNSPPTYYPPLLCITTANQKIGSQYSQLQKWVDSFSFKKKVFELKNTPKKKYQNNHN